MLDFLDRLRQKSPEERMFIAVTTAGSITAVIALVWMVSFGATIQKGVAPVADSMPLDELRKQIDGTFEQGQRFMGSLSDLKDSFAATTTSTSTVADSAGTTSTDAVANAVDAVIVATSTTPTKPAPIASSTVEIIGP